MSINRYEAVVEINAPTDEVYSYVADLSKHREWNHQPQKITKLTDGPVGVGSKFKAEEGMPSNASFGQRIMMAIMIPLMKMRHKFDGDTIAEITELKENDLVKWTAYLPNRDGKRLMQMHWELDLDAAVGNNTVITQRCHMDPPADSPFSALINGDFVKRGQQEAQANLNNLKSLLEGKS